MKHLLYLLAGILILQSMTCEPDITFYEPQPAGIASLKAIPGAFAGQYISKEDPSALEINGNMIIASSDYDHTIHQKELDSIRVISGDHIVDLESGEHIPFTYKGDSLILHIHDVDTMFNLQKGHLIKKYKNAWFLNILHDAEKWEVVKMEMNENQLKLSKIDKDKELQTLIDITQMPQDTVPPYRFSATKSQFSEFIKGKGFKDQNVYVKL